MHEATTTNKRAEQRIRMFRPSEDPVAARAYVEGQRRALADFGVHRTTSMDLAWSDPGVRLVLVEGNDGDARGGICIHQQTRSNVLPVARALASLEPRVHETLISLAHLGVAELCAGWVSQKHRGAGLYAAAIHAAMAVMPLLAIPNGVGFGYTKTLGLYRALGFEADHTLGDGGTFAYPDARYRSTVMWGDCQALAATEEQHRDRILALRAALIRASDQPFGLSSTLYELNVRPQMTRARTA